MLNTVFGGDNSVFAVDNRVFGGDNSIFAVDNRVFDGDNVVPSTLKYSSVRVCGNCILKCKIFTSRARYTE